MHYLSAKSRGTCGNGTFVLASFIVITTFATLGLKPASGVIAASAAPSLTGDAAVMHLKEQGLNSSLAEAVRAARHSGSADRKAISPQATDSSLVLLTRFLAEDRAPNDHFGVSVAISGDTAVVGAYGDDIGPAPTDRDEGSAWVLVRVGGAWSFQQKLTAGDRATGDNFGISVSVSGDTVVVGSNRDDIGTNVDQGSAYVFVRANGVWSLQQKLTANDGVANDFFGSSVALRGDTLVVGAPSDDNGATVDQGSAYVFVRVGTAWTLQQKLITINGRAGDNFGNSVSVSGDTAVIGAYLANNGFPNQGVAYVFVRVGTAWTQQERLTGDDDFRPNRTFGRSVAVGGDTAIVGAPSDDIGPNVDQGSAYVYVRTGTVWTLQKKLIANDGATDDNFGESVALDGNMALVGAYSDTTGAHLSQGSAYVFSRSGATWTQQPKLSAPDGETNDQFGWAVAISGNTGYVGIFNAPGGTGAVYVVGCGYVDQILLSAGVGDEVGQSVAISGDTAVAGAPYDDVGTETAQGSAFVFVRVGGMWSLQRQLFSHDGVKDDRFGWSVAISGDIVVVGAPGKTIGMNAVQGAAYVFVRSGTTWIEQQRLTADDGLVEMTFGISVAIDGTPRIAVGAPSALNGAVYLYTRPGLTWTQEKKLTANDGAQGDQLGFTVSLAGGLVLAGAPEARVGTNNVQGAAYVFNLNAITPQTAQRKLTANDGASEDRFGTSVAVNGNTALVGAKDNGGATPGIGPGAAYVFVGTGIGFTSWTQQAKLQPRTAMPDDDIGFSVALSSNIAVVGARHRDFLPQLNRGAVYIFVRTGTLWPLQQELVASTGMANDEFGDSVAIDRDTVMVGAPSRDMSRGTVYACTYNCSATLAAIASVSAASFAPDGQLALESIVAGFGSSLAPGTQSASGLPLPTSLVDVKVRIRDSASVERLSPLFFVSPAQINYEIPLGTVGGQATVTVSRDDNIIAAGSAVIVNVAPGVFSANSNGQGVAAALALRVTAGGTQVFEPVARFDATLNRFVAVPIDLGPETDQVFLVLFGTGIRFRSALAGVSLTIGGTSSDVVFAGEAPGFVGLDQVNARLARSLAGRGEIDVVLTVDGHVANTVRASIR